MSQTPTKQDLRDELAASKVLSYLKHAASMIECHTDRITEGPFTGEFIMYDQHRSLLGWMLDDIEAELMKIEAFQQAAGFEEALRRAEMRVEAKQCACKH